MKKVKFDYTNLFILTKDMGFTHINDGIFEFCGNEIDLSATAENEKSVLKTTFKQLIKKMQKTPNKNVVYGLEVLNNYCINKNCDFKFIQGG